MPRVYFHYHDGAERIVDLEGAELSPEASRARALEQVRALVAQAAILGRIDFRQRIDIEDMEGTVLDSISFADAVEIVGLPVARAFENGGDALSPPLPCIRQPRLSSRRRP